MIIAIFSVVFSFLIARMEEPGSTYRLDIQVLVTASCDVAK